MLGRKMRPDMLKSPLVPQLLFDLLCGVYQWQLLVGYVRGTWQLDLSCNN